jgi:hypothetical protein
LLLMFVAQHDDAYAWARNHCVDCIAGHDEVRVRLTPVGPDGERRVDLAADARTWIVETIEQLEALFGEFGVAAAGA